MSLAPASYDRKAALYDAVVGRPWYHRVFWGTSPGSFTRFAREALDSAGDGAFAEVGSGSLLFSAGMYREARRTPALLVDRSIVMLDRGMARVGAAPSQPIPIQADAAALPLRSRAVATILSLNFIHVPCDRAGVASELERILAPGGRLFLSALVRTGRWSDKWMSFLYRAGELGPPMTVDELRKLVAGDWAVVESQRVEGNMCFIIAQKKRG